MISREIPADEHCGRGPIRGDSEFVPHWRVVNHQRASDSLSEPVSRMSLAGALGGGENLALEQALYHRK